ncbi:chemotaxis protein CheB [Aquisalimonas sp.]|uniref:chemotaxis protein CheB n=1 Tax=Aquisalimonas sp. TaxID=1872621 RepID=UPI0025BC3C67|nr:chemotaxis protein CheB [Aquisalimonas sp.]
MRAVLREGLAQHGLEVALETDLANVLAGLSRADLQALVVDMRTAGDRDLDALNTLLDGEDLPPVLFHEEAPAHHQHVWIRRLAGKILGMVAPAATGDAIALETPVPEMAAGPRLWVLGSSVGGPQAVKRFLGAFPVVPEATLIVVQHIGVGFVDLLAAQLDRATRLHVEPLSEGVDLHLGRVYVMPVNHALYLSDMKRVELRAEPAPGRRCSPSIDGVMREVARVYGPSAGAIVFSGMGDDGTEGAQAVAAAGGTVWAQDAASCAISSMPNRAAATGVVAWRGNPEELARALLHSTHPEQQQA